MIGGKKAVKNNWNEKVNNNKIIIKKKMGCNLQREQGKWRDKIKLKRTTTKKRNRILN